MNNWFYLHVLPTTVLGVRITRSMDAMTVVPLIYEKIIAGTGYSAEATIYEMIQMVKNTS